MFGKVVAFHEKEFLERLVHAINFTFQSGEMWTIEKFEESALSFARGLHCGEITERMCLSVVQVLRNVGGEYLSRWTDQDLLTIVQGAAPSSDAAGNLPSMQLWLDQILEDPRLPNYIYQEHIKGDLLDKITKAILEIVITGWA